MITIPTASPSVSSINLAQAVLILGYELLTVRTQDPPPSAVKLAPAGEVQAMYDHMKRAFTLIGFLPEMNTDHWLMSFKRIFNRAGLTEGDCNLLRGLCRRIENAVYYGPRPGKGKNENRAMDGIETAEL